MKSTSTFQSPLSSEDVKIKNRGQGRIFKNPLLDFLTRSSPLITIINYGLICTTLVLINFRLEAVTSVGTVVLIYGSGLIVWTLAEYLLHRYIFHFISENKHIMRFHYVMHGYHHEYPRDPERLFMPPLPGWIISGIFAVVFVLLLGPIGWVFAAGFVNGYLMYTLVHYSTHRLKPPKLLKGIWKHHSLHHYKYHDRAFGVSSPFWDHIFRTLPPRDADAS